jgi:hypothetical protein
MKATSSRRRLIVAVLLALALLGAIVRQWAPNPSLARDVGTLLLVLWLPVIGQVVAFVIARLRPRRPGLGFGPGAPFSPHVLVELTSQPDARPPLPPNERCCTLAIGNEGFTARLPVPLAQWLAGDEAMQVQFLRPGVALPRFTAGAEFTVLVGQAVAGQGRVVRGPD